MQKVEKISKSFLNLYTNATEYMVVPDNDSIAMIVCRLDESFFHNLGLRGYHLNALQADAS